MRFLTPLERRILATLAVPPSRGWWTYAALCEELDQEDAAAVASALSQLRRHYLVEQHSPAYLRAYTLSLLGDAELQAHSEEGRSA